jgi:chaperonin GroES
MKVKANGDRVLVKRIPEATVSKGGIIIPDAAKEKPVEGTVVSVGLGKMTEHGTRIPLAFKDGDHVIFGRFAGKEIKIDGEDYVALADADIIAFREA